MIALAFAAATLVVYAFGVSRYRRRFPGRPFPAWRIAAFVCGLGAASTVLLPPVDSLADSSFAWHMLQHLSFVLVAPPLLLLGAPLLLLVSATPPAFARRITALAGSPVGDALFAPVTGWLAYVFVLWGAHFSPLYELSLEHPAVHVAEHALFFGTGLLFWASVVQVGYSPRPLAFPARMFYLFLALPQAAFVAFAIGAAQHVLYPHYTSLADQRSGADLMWILGGFLMFVAFMAQAGAWAYAERKAVPA